MQKLSRNVSPAPDQASKRSQPAVKRTIAPGQVCLKSLLWSCMVRCHLKPPCTCLCAPVQPAPGARSKEKFVSLPEELEALELPPPQPDVPQQLFAVGFARAGDT